jgi:ATP-dependent RNA helicase RhlE
MLDMGFIRDIKKVLAVVPKQRQTLLFSATFSDEIRTLANSLLNNPKSVEVARRNTAVEIIEQSMHRVPQAHKRDLLAHLIKHHDWQQVLVFTRTKHGANKLAEKLIKDGIGAAAIHGNKSQSARTKALASFKDGSVRVLVATDIAARGIDIDQLPQVVNFELPNVAEDYVHRIGRTGRAGSTGSALSLVDDEEMSYLRDIERLIKRAIVRVEIEPGFVPPAKADLMSDERPPRPPQGRGGQRQGQNARQPQSGNRNASGRAPQGAPASAGAKPASSRANPNQSAQPRKPRPQAALFSSKPGSRGH